MTHQGRRRHTRGSAIATLVVLASVTAGGCGGSSDLRTYINEQWPSVKALERQANVALAEVNTAAEDRVALLRDVLPEKVLPTLDQARQRAEALEIDHDELAALNARYVELLAHQRERMLRLYDAAVQRDLEAIDRINDEIAETNAARRRWLEDLTRLCEANGIRFEDR